MKTITLKFDTGTITEKVITVHDFEFNQKEILWDDEDVSITGKKRNTHRGYQAELILEFEHNDQLLSVAQDIYNTLKVGSVYYAAQGEDINMVPVEFEHTNNYLWQIRRRTAVLVLEGDLEDGIFSVRRILCGFTDVFCGQTDVNCGGGFV